MRRPSTTRARARAAAALLAGTVLSGTALAGCVPPPGEEPGESAATRSSPTAPSRPTPPDAGDEARDRPLDGVVVALDPGHNAGNATSPETRRQVVAGPGLVKDCNSTGAMALDGATESAHTWAVAEALARALSQRGATTALTRDADDGWGPCVDARGRFGAEQGADLMVSLHADGAGSDGEDRGFHVIRPGPVEGWTDDVVLESEALAVALRDALVDAGFEPSTYLGVDGIDVRTDLGTLNWSDVPVALVETHNMHDPVEGPAMRTPEVLGRLVDAVADGVETYVTEHRG